MTHPTACDPALIVLAFSGDLSPAEKIYLEAHLEVCPACSARRNQMSLIAPALVACLSKAAVSTPPAGMQARFLACAQQAGIPLSARRSLAPVPLLQLACLVLLILFAVVQQHPRSKPVTTPEARTVAISQVSLVPSSERPAPRTLHHRNRSRQPVSSTWPPPQPLFPLTRYSSSLPVRPLDLAALARPAATFPIVHDPVPFHYNIDLAALHLQDSPLPRLPHATDFTFTPPPTQ